MSGWVAIRPVDGAPVDPALLGRALEAAEWRGPDGRGIWVGPGIGLAHCRMETTPEEQGVEQPLPSEDQQCRIVWDGRLDYREELIAALGLPRSTSAPDAALALEAYARWGVEGVERLEGDFAFALWDGARQRLLCARDRFGIRPFHYHWDGRRFLAASETIQLLAAGVPDTPNDWILLRTLAARDDESEETVYRAIQHLPPAHLLVVERGQMIRRRYWSPDPRHTVRVRGPQEAAEGCLALLRGAVRTRLRAAGPVAAHLSGGLDSSSIVCLAAEAPAASRLFTLAATFREFPSCNEDPYVEAVRDQVGVVHYPVVCDQFGPFDPPEVPYVFTGEPSWAPIDPFNRVIMQEVHRRGARVVLSGVGGDQVMLTEPLFLADLLARGSLGRFRQEIMRKRRSRRDVLWEYTLRPLGFAGLFDLKRDLLTWRRGGDLPPWVRVDARTRWRLIRASPWVNPPRRFAWRHGAARFLQTTRGLTPGGAQLFEDLAYPYPIETRYPFLDARLLEYLMALPPEVVGQLGDSRYFHRLALARVLPEVVRCRRTKGDFSALYHHGLKVRRAALVRELLRAPRLQDLPFFDLDGARRWYEEYLQSDTIHPQPMYGLFALEAWMTERQAGYQPKRAAGALSASV